MRRYCPDEVQLRIAAKALSLAVVMGAVVVMAGWIFDIGVLKSVSPGWVTMKFDTAVAFILSGITLFFIARSAEGKVDQAQFVLSVTTLAIVLLMGTLLFANILGVRTGLEELFVKDAAVSAGSVVPGRPSIPTMLNFLLIAFAGLSTVLDAKREHPRRRTIGVTVGLIGAAAIAGYVFRVPVLYFYVPGVNSAMAVHTAFLFVMLGSGLSCL
jgi:hypothetical protein